MSFFPVTSDDALSFREFFIERYFTDTKYFPDIYRAWHKHIVRQSVNPMVNMGYAYLPEGHSIILSTVDNPDMLMVVNARHLPKDLWPEETKEDFAQTKVAAQALMDRFAALHQSDTNKYLSSAKRYRKGWVNCLPETAAVAGALADKLNTDRRGLPSNTTVSAPSDPVIEYRKKKNYRYIKVTSSLQGECCGYCGNNRRIYDYVEKTLYCSTTFSDGTDGVLGVTIDVPRCSKCHSAHNVINCKEMPHIFLNFTGPVMIRSLGCLGMLAFIVFNPVVNGLHILLRYDSWMLRIRRLFGFKTKVEWDTDPYEPYETLAALGMNTTEYGAHGLVWKKIDYNDVVASIDDLCRKYPLSRSNFYNLSVKQDPNQTPLSYQEAYDDKEKKFKGKGWGCLIVLILLVIAGLCRHALYSLL